MSTHFSQINVMSLHMQHKYAYAVGSRSFAAVLQRFFLRSGGLSTTETFEMLGSGCTREFTKFELSYQTRVHVLFVSREDYPRHLIFLNFVIRLFAISSTLEPSSRNPLEEMRRPKEDMKRIGGASRMSRMCTNDGGNLTFRQSIGRRRLR